MNSEALAKTYGPPRLQAAIGKPVIPPRSTRRFPAEFDRHTDTWRHLIENFFVKLKQHRGIVTRLCKTDESFTALAASPAVDGRAVGVAPQCQERRGRAGNAELADEAGRCASATF